MMPEFIRRIRYSGTAWQVCHASHYTFFNMYFRRLLVKLTSPQSASGADPYNYCPTDGCRFDNIVADNLWAFTDTAAMAMASCFTNMLTTSARLAQRLFWKVTSIASDSRSNRRSQRFAEAEEYLRWRMSFVEIQRIGAASSRRRLLEVVDPCGPREL